MKGCEFAIELDPVEEALIGALAKQNNITDEEQVRRIVRRALDELSRKPLAAAEICRQ